MSSLQHTFDAFNREWFGNQLPPDTIVKWATIKGMGTYNDGVIEVNRKLREWPPAWKLTLLHEMAHLATDSELAEHGPRWLRQMHSLARRGAFDKFW